VSADATDTWKDLSREWAAGLLLPATGFTPLVFPNSNTSHYSTGRPISGHPKSAAICRSGRHSSSVSSEIPGTQSCPNGPVGTVSCLAENSGAGKCRTSARLVAVSSRTVSGFNPQRHSIILSTDV